MGCSDLAQPKNLVGSCRALVLANFRFLPIYKVTLFSTVELSVCKFLSHFRAHYRSNPSIIFLPPLMSLYVCAMPL